MNSTDSRITLHPKTDFKVYRRKIDIFIKSFKDKKFYYYASTYAYKTCKQAKESFCVRHSLDNSQVKTNFSTK